MEKEFNIGNVVILKGMGQDRSFIVIGKENDENNSTSLICIPVHKYADLKDCFTKRCIILHEPLFTDQRIGYAYIDGLVIISSFMVDSLDKSISDSSLSYLVDCIDNYYQEDVNDDIYLDYKNSRMEDMSNKKILGKMIKKY